MRNIFLALLLLVAVFLQAQYKISGTFAPSKDFSWLIAYQLKSGTQVYSADTAIKNGIFSLELPQNAPKGTYRMVYAVPQEQFYFDVIYNGTENIILTFDSTEGVTFYESKENILFSTYFKEINALEQALISFYSNDSADTKAYQKISNAYLETQKSYEEKSEGLLVNQFIKANKAYLSGQYESIQDYVQNRKKFYFKYLDVSNTALQASGFLTDKLTNYVFTALPLEQLEKHETEKEIQSNITTVFDNLNEVSTTYSFHVMYTLWTQSSRSGFDETADFIFSKYLKTSDSAIKNKDIITKIEIYNRLRIGAVAPEIEWKKGDKKQKLSALMGAKNYVLVFWSSTCGHCLKELPALHKKLRENKEIQVVAIGLEDDMLSWDIERAKLQNFEHAFALGKWNNEYANLYDISATPTYFILDERKKIVAKPENDKEVVEFLERK